MTLIIINVTDNAIGIENAPSDVDVEIRDYRDEVLEKHVADAFRIEGNREYIPYTFGKIDLLP